MHGSLEDHFLVIRITYLITYLQLNKGQGTATTLNAVLRIAGYFAIIIRIYLTSKHVKEAFMIGL